MPRMHSLKMAVSSLPTKIMTTVTVTLLFLHHFPPAHALSSLQGPGYNSKPVSPQTPRAQQVLDKLNLQASAEPKLLVADTESIPTLLSATAPALLRAASGVFAQGYKVELVPRDDTKYAYAALGEKQLQETGVYLPPSQPIILYEFEACPFCRKVREACSMLSLPVLFRPTPKDGRRFRPEIKNKYGTKATFPYLEDPNTLTTMFESQQIIEYLFRVYGNGQPVPWTLQESPLVPLTAGLGVGLLRFGAGGQSEFSNSPPMPLILYAYEGSPYCKVVRERLSALELEHIIYHTPRGSENRAMLWKETGRFQVPYLVDPNTEVKLFESDAIVEYLEKQYAVQPSPVEIM